MATVGGSQPDIADSKGRRFRVVRPAGLRRGDRRTARRACRANVMKYVLLYESADDARAKGRLRTSWLIRPVTRQPVPAVTFSCSERSKIPSVKALWRSSGPAKRPRSSPRRFLRSERRGPGLARPRAERGAGRRRACTGLTARCIAAWRRAAQAAAWTSRSGTVPRPKTYLRRRPGQRTALGPAAGPGGEIVVPPQLRSATWPRPSWPPGPPWRQAAAWLLRARSQRTSAGR